MSPNVVLISGLPGTGKSSIGRILAEEYRFFHLEASDIVKAKYVTEHEDGESFLAYVQRIFNSASFSFALAAAEKCIGNQSITSNIVLTGLRKPLEIEAFKSLIPDSQVIYLKCDPNIRRSRKPEIDPATGLSFQERDEIEISWGVELVEHKASLIIDSSIPLSECIASLTEFFESKFYTHISHLPISYAWI